MGLRQDGQEFEFRPDFVLEVLEVIVDPLGLEVGRKRFGHEAAAGGREGNFRLFLLVAMPKGTEGQAAPNGVVLEVAEGRFTAAATRPSGPMQSLGT